MKLANSVIPNNITLHAIFINYQSLTRIASHLSRISNIVPIAMFATHLCLHISEPDHVAAIKAPAPYPSHSLLSHFQSLAVGISTYLRPSKTTLAALARLKAETETRLAHLEAKTEARCLFMNLARHIAVQAAAHASRHPIHSRAFDHIKQSRVGSFVLIR